MTLKHRNEHAIKQMGLPAQGVLRVIRAVLCRDQLTAEIENTIRQGIGNVGRRHMMRGRAVEHRLKRAKDLQEGNIRRIRLCVLAQRVIATGVSRRRDVWRREM